MSRTKVKTECRLKSWPEVDAALKKISERERVLDDLNNDMNAEIDAIKERFARQAQPVREQLEHYSADVCQFVTEHRGEMAGKSVKLNFGSVGFRISTKLQYRKGVKAADVVAALLRLNLGGCVKITRTVIADNLKKQPIDVLDQVGAYLSQKDEFWLDTAQEEIQPTKGADA